MEIDNERSSCLKGVQCFCFAVGDGRQVVWVRTIGCGFPLPLLNDC